MLRSPSSSRLEDPAPPAEPADAAVVKVRGLSVEYGPMRVLNNVEMTVEPGEVFVVLSQGGGGKTTLFRHLLALEPVSPGRVWLFGEDIARVKGRALRNLRTKVGAAHQQGALFSSLSVLENVMLPLLELADLDRETVGIISRMKLQQVQMLGFEDMTPAQLSAAMVQRTAIARALALDPKLLLCDDIFSGLDRGAIQEIEGLIRDLRQAFQLTIMVLTPNPEVALTLGDRIGVLYKGEIVAVGTPDEIRESAMPSVRYLVHGEAMDEESDLAAWTHLFGGSA